LLTKEINCIYYKIVMIINLELIKNTLQEKGIKERNRVHPSAETIFKALKKKNPTLSRASVYNTLNVFNEKGLTTPLYINGSEAHFDRNANPHQHFFCKKCKKIIDLDIECTYFKEGDVKGHKITELHGYFAGICKDCLKKGSK